MAVPEIVDHLRGATLRFLTLTDMWNTIVERTTTTLAPSDLGRLAQLLKAARGAPTALAPARRLRPLAPTLGLPSSRGCSSLLGRADLRECAVVVDALLVQR